MKNILIAAIAMAGIIAMQIVLSYAFHYQAGEIFSKVALGGLFYYFLIRFVNRNSKASE